MGTKSLEDRLWSGLDSFVNTLRETQIEILLFGVLGLGIGTAPIINHELERASLKPTYFSEVHNRILEAKTNNEPLSASNLEPMYIADFIAKVNESHNNSITEPGDEYGNFEWELFGVHGSVSPWRINLKDMFNMIPSLADSARVELNDFENTQTALIPVRDAFHKSWNEKTEDITRTEVRIYTVSVSDGNGNSHMETRTEIVQVYDHTNYDYSYFEFFGKKGFKDLNEVFSLFPKLNTPLIKPSSKTGADNEYAIYSSRKTISKKKMEDYTPEDFLYFSQQWFRESTIINSLERMNKVYSKLHILNKKWGSELPIAPQYDGFHKEVRGSYAGPEPFQTCESLEAYSNDFINAEQSILDGFELTKKVLVELDKTMSIYQGVVIGDITKQDSLYEKPWKLKKKIMNLNEDLVRFNFQGGFELNKPRYWLMALEILGLGLVSGLFGAGVDFLTTRFNLYDKIPLHHASKKIKQGILNKMSGYRRNYFDESNPFDYETLKDAHPDDNWRFL